MNVPTREPPQPTAGGPLDPRPPRPRRSARALARGAATAAFVIYVGLAAAVLDGYFGGHETASPGASVPVPQVVAVTAAGVWSPPAFEPPQDPRAGPSLLQLDSFVQIP